MSILGDIVAAIVRIIKGPLSSEDRAAQLDKLADESPQRLDWRNSIVDLMKLTGQDSSLSARKELAQELGYEGELDGSAEMNTWLHQKVMERLK